MKVEEVERLHPLREPARHRNGHQFEQERDPASIIALTRLNITSYMQP